MFHFELQAVCPETGARAGILHTAHGDVETPVFMPVGTQAAVKGVLPRDLDGQYHSWEYVSPLSCGRAMRRFAGSADCMDS